MPDKTPGKAARPAQESAAQPDDAPAKKTPRRAPRLGRGLSSLMGQAIAIKPVGGGTGGTEGAADIEPNAAAIDSPDQGRTVGTPLPSPSSDLVYLPLESVTPNPNQPRKRFNDASIERLAKSIREDGVIQPVVVRPIEGKVSAEQGGHKYQLVAGERRWRAAQIAGIKELIAIIRPMDDRKVAAWSLIENLQREDLNPIDRAQAFAALATGYAMSHADVADRVGVERPTVTNAIRLLDLAEPVQDMVRTGTLTAGHGKAIAAVTDPTTQQQLAQAAAANRWSVRRTEQAARQANTTVGGSTPGSPTTPETKNTNPTRAHIQHLQDTLSKQLGTKTTLRPARKKGAGTLTIAYYSLDHFESLLQRLNVEID